MQTWFECRVKSLKIYQGGHERKVTENYLLDAISFTEAEARIIKQMNELTNGTFEVVNIKKSNITEVSAVADGQYWYKVKINIVTIDEEKGKEKKVNQYILVSANDTDQALEVSQSHLDYVLVPFEITGVNLSNIVDVFPNFE